MCFLAFAQSYDVVCQVQHFKYSDYEEKLTNCGKFKIPPQSKMLKEIVLSDHTFPTMPYVSHDLHSKFSSKYDIFLIVEALMHIILRDLTLEINNAAHRKKFTFSIC